ncbi:MAG: hypothetical protein MI922_28645, partial [Bacteroidales bacterium]|nr:hypothetical protein [Bacteroidales bacterium]
MIIVNFALYKTLFITQQLFLCYKPTYVWLNHQNTKFHKKAISNMKENPCASLPYSGKTMMLLPQYHQG